MYVKRARLLSVLGAASAVGLLSATGCGKSDDGMNQQQLEKASRLDEIAKKSDGNWDRVSPADRDFILKNLTSGSEQGAKMLLLAKAGKLKGGPPGGGAPGGGPPR